MKRKLSILLVLAMLLNMFGAFAVTGTAAGTTDAPESLKVLIIGSSFGRNSIWQMGNIAENLGIEDYKFGSLFRTACTLSVHWQLAQSGSAGYLYNECSDENPAWSTQNNVSMLQGILKDDWDYIVLQQSAEESANDWTYNGSENNLINLANHVQMNKTNPECKVVFNMVWSFAGGNILAGNHANNQENMYYATVRATKMNVLNNPQIDFIIPSGTSIQNVRTSFIGNTLNYDSMHLNSLGETIAGYTWYRYLTGGASIDDATFIPDAYAEYADTYLPVIKEAVNNAYEEPYFITYSQYKAEDATAEPTPIATNAPDENGKIIIPVYSEDFENYETIDDVMEGGWSLNKTTTTVSDSVTTEVPNAALKDENENKYLDLPSGANGAHDFIPFAVNHHGGPSLGRNAKLVVEFDGYFGTKSGASLSYYKLDGPEYVGNNNAVGRLTAVSMGRRGGGAIRYSRSIASNSTDFVITNSMPKFTKIKFVINLTDDTGRWYDVGSDKVDVYCGDMDTPVEGGVGLSMISRNLHAVERFTAGGACPSAVDNINIYAVVDSDSVPTMAPTEEPAPTPVPDKEALSSLIAEATALYETANANIGEEIGQYSQAVVTALNTAINEATLVNNNENAYQGLIDAKVTYLTNKMNATVPNATAAPATVAPTDPSVTADPQATATPVPDKTALSDALDVAAERKTTASGNIGEADGQYSQAVVSALIAAMDEAYAVMDKVDANQSEIDQATKNLIRAIKNCIAIGESTPTPVPWDGTTVTEPSKNSDGVYEISNGAELAWFRDYVNVRQPANITFAPNAATDAVLTDNIDLNNQQFLPMGIAGNAGDYPSAGTGLAYTGNFDGQGYVISNVNINYSGDGAGTAGLFANTNGATIKDLGVEGNVSIICTGAGSSGARRVTIAGGIVGQAIGSTKVSGCYFIGNVSASSTGKYTTTFGVGGIIGSASSNDVVVENCYSHGTLLNGASSQLAQQDPRMGGIVGSTAIYRKANNDYSALYYTPAITNCYSTMTATSTGKTTGFIGPIVGEDGTAFETAPVVTNCYYLADYAYTPVYATKATSLTDGTLATDLGGAYIQGLEAPVLKWQGANASIPTPAPEQTATPIPTVAPTVTPEPTIAPTETPEPTATPETTATPAPTPTPQPGSLEVWDGMTVIEPAKDENGVYQISNGAELAWFRDYVNARGFANNRTFAPNAVTDAVLTDDIDLNNQLFLPIGLGGSNAGNYPSTGTNTVYGGVFDGQGHVISNVNIAYSGDGAGTAGLFAVTSGATIKNLGVKGNVSITCTGTGTSGARKITMAGGIIGQAIGSTKVSGCYFIGNVSASSTGKYTTTYGVGGIIGAATSNDVVVENCYSHGAMTNAASSQLAQQNPRMGGIIGSTATYRKANNDYSALYYTPVITNCYSTMTATSTGKTTGLIGPIVGEDGTVFETAPVVTNCYYVTDYDYTPVYATKATSLTDGTLATALDGAFAQGIEYPILVWETDLTPVDPTPTPAPTTPPVSDVVYGDADGDGEVTVSDATTVLLQVAGALEEGEIDIASADADGDGEITVSDATAILLHVAGALDNLGPSEE